MRLVFAQDGMLRETPVAGRVVVCIMALVSEVFQTFPDPTLELENNEKRPGNVRLRTETLEISLKFG